MSTEIAGGEGTRLGKAGVCCLYLLRGLKELLELAQDVQRLLSGLLKSKTEFGSHFLVLDNDGLEACLEEHITDGDPRSISRKGLLAVKASVSELFPEHLVPPFCSVPILGAKWLFHYPGFALLPLKAETLVHSHPR